MKMLLHKGDISKKLNGLKQSIKTSIASKYIFFVSDSCIIANDFFFLLDDMDIPFADVIHQKIASEDDREILFISKKSSEKFSNFKNMIQREFGQKSSQDQQSTSQSSITSTQLNRELILKTLNVNGKDDEKSTDSFDNDDILGLNVDFEESENKSEEIPLIIELNYETEKKDSPVREPVTSVDQFFEVNIIKSPDVNVLKRPFETKPTVNSDISEPKIPRLSPEVQIKKVSVPTLEEHSDTDDEGKKILNSSFKFIF
jgi:hypothetical protein